MFHAKVNDEEISVGCFMFHAREMTAASGFAYEVSFDDVDLFNELAKYSNKVLDLNDTGRIFRAISLTVSVTYPHEKQNPIRFWAETISSFTNDNNTIVIKGVCSPHAAPIH